MRHLLAFAEKYLRKSTWGDIIIIKACVFFLGVFTGTYIPKKKANTIRKITLFGFIVTLIPILAKLFKVSTDKTE